MRSNWKKNLTKVSSHSSKSCICIRIKVSSDERNPWETVQKTPVETEEGTVQEMNIGPVVEGETQAFTYWTRRRGLRKPWHLPKMSPVGQAWEQRKPRHWCSGLTTPPLCRCSLSSLWAVSEVSHQDEVPVQIQDTQSLLTWKHKKRALWRLHAAWCQPFLSQPFRQPASSPQCRAHPSPWTCLGPGMK